jgi:hypothetical protein
VAQAVEYLLSKCQDLEFKPQYPAHSPTKILL